MKTSTILLLAAIALSSCSCGSKPANPADDAATDSATISTDTTAATTEAATPATPAFTAQGIGPVKMQTAIKSLPKQADGLYDKIDLVTEHNDMEDEDVYTATFSLNGQKMFSAMAGDDGAIFYISTDSPTIRLDIDGTGVGVGTPVKDLLKLKGVKKGNDYAAQYGDVWFNADASGTITEFGIGGW